MSRYGRQVRTSGMTQQTRESHAVKKILSVIVAIALIAALAHYRSASSPAPLASPQSTSDNAALERAIETQAENVSVQGQGTVVKILADDNEGSRHQRFIVQLPSGHTILIAHNIDLAGRVTPLAEGDAIEFNGEYAWNPKGGVVHWTHHDPAGRHPAGWIRHAGQTVQ
jgi:hypothetical protein